MHEIVSGILVSIKNYGQNDVLLSILLETSVYIKEYLPNQKRSYSVGQRLVLRVLSYDGKRKIFVDSIENSLIQVFFHDIVILQRLGEVLLLVDLLPQNIVFEGLYDRFLSIIKLLHQKDSVQNWSNYLKNLS